MKKFTLFTALFSLAFLGVVAQKAPAVDNPQQKSRCATMDYLEQWLQNNPEYRAQTAKPASAFENMPSGQMHQRGTIVTIPVVVHLVLTAARQAQVTDADVIWQINKMNEDFAGVNADSTNAVPFYPIRGRSDIRFCLARQDAQGNPTNGINRVVSTITSFGCGDGGAILKADATCGATAWNPNSYFNIWVGQGGGCLGVATFPGTGTAAQQGIVLDLTGFSNNPLYVSPAFNLGRTAVHEAGHYFGLYHIWGDDGNACTGDDFRQLPGSCLVPGSLLAGDTPNQTGPISGCPSGLRTDACSPAAPGINYQNYMDYTDDACYSMFTKKQVERAEWVLDNCRASLATSNGCVPVTVFPLDANLRAVLNPGPGNCTTPGTPTGFCPGTVFTPRVQLRNMGTSTLTSVKINYRIGTGAPAVFNWSGSLTQFSSTVVTLPNVTAPATPGATNFQVYTTDPNGGADGRAANDTASVGISIGGGAPPPLFEGFESTTFPPVNWNRINSDGGLTWQRRAGTTTFIPFQGTAAAWVNLYNYGTRRQVDELRTPVITTSGADSVKLSFAVAYALYSNTDIDTLEVKASSDCGITFQSIYKKWGGPPSGSNPNGLATAPLTTASFAPNGPAQWRVENVDLTSFIPAGNVQLSFNTINQFGNNAYIDAVNVTRVVLLNRDATLTGVNDPNGKVCTPSFIPNIRLQNRGKDTLKSVTINYQIDGANPPSTFNWTGSLPKGQGTTVALNSVTTAVGPHTFKSWTSNPNGQVDQDPTNDTTTSTFNTLKTVPTPLSEGFEGTVFPPADWLRANQDGLGTWFRSTAASRIGTASAAMDNYNYNANGTSDDLETPVLTYAGVDSSWLSFDVSNASFEYPGQTSLKLDTLEVLLTRDCGKTFTSIYKKWGEDLQTINNPNDPQTDLFIPRSPNQWRNERVDLTRFLGGTSTFQLIIRNRGNFGNSTFIDNVNVNTRVLPAKLKSQGYLILPSPFQSNFTIMHYLAPTDLQYYQIFNSAGQLVAQKKFNGNASSNLSVNLLGKPAGIYTIKLAYTGRVITERIVKTN